jgi:hypothetical protein
MSDEYFEQTSTFILARFFGHESLLISKGIYAKLRGDRDLKGEIKAGIHRLSTAIGKAGLLYYHRLQLGEMSLDGEHFVTFTTFQDRWGAPRFDAAVSVAKSVLAALSAEDLETIRQTSGQLLERLSRKTGVPSALKLAGDGTSRGPRLTEEPDKRF